MPADRADDTITVTGDAVVDATPDETRFRLTLTAVRPAADEALEDVMIRSDRLDALLTDLGIGHERRSTSGLSIREKRRWLEEGTPGEPSVLEGFEAITRLVVRLDDPSLTGRLIQRAVEEVDASVDGPYWHIRDDNPARIEAPARAIRDAERRARVFAEAAGVRLGPVRSIVDLSAWDRPGGRMVGHGATMAEGVTVDANIQFGASVTVTYGIER